MIVSTGDDDTVSDGIGNASASKNLASDKTSPECKPQVLIPKSTSVFGYVTERKHRHFPFDNGELQVMLDKIKVWDGHRIEVVIARRACEKTDKKCQKQRNKNACEVSSNCVAGRHN